MTRRRFTQLSFFVLAVSGVMMSANRSCGEVFTFDFAQEDFGWSAGFADYPSDTDPDIYDLQSDYRPRSANLGSAGSIYISGHNHSDDLFMFVKRPLDGLLPNTLNRLVFHLELASKDRTGLGGIGGSPGDSVWLKAGASPIEPNKIIGDLNWYRMNIDKGNQSVGGQDALLLGTIAKPDDGNEEYVLIQRDNVANPMYGWSNASGRLWLLVGTDSGFEGPTSLYYTKIIVDLAPVFNPLRVTRQGATVRLEWDKGVLQTTSSFSEQWTDAPGATSPRDENVAGITQKFWRLRSTQP